MLQFGPLTDQVVHRILWFGFTDLNEALGDGGDHMTHEVVPEWQTLCLQHLPLLFLNVLQLSSLGGWERGREEREGGREGGMEGERETHLTPQIRLNN